MTKDKLIPVIEDIQNWCESNEIVCFVGHTQDEPFIIYSYEKESNNEWIKFLQIAKKINVNIMVLEKKINFLKTLYEDDFEILLSQDDLEQSTKKQYENALKYDGEIALIKLSFHYNEVCYEFTITSEWYIDYFFALTEVEESDDVDNQISNISSQENTPKRHSEQEIEDYSRKITEHDDFIKAKSKIHREEITKKVLKEILGDKYNELPYFYWSVVRRTEGIFEIEIKPKIEFEIKQRVLELKSQGFKKVEIRSKLDISEGMVDRFYHIE